MTSKLIAAAAAVCLYLPAQPASGLAAEVRAAEAGYAAAVSAGNIKDVERILSDELIYTHSTALVENKGEFLAKLKAGHQKYASIDYSDTRVRVYGNTGVLTTKARMRGATKGVPFDNTLLMIHIWVKQGGRWQLVAHQTTKVP